MEAVPAVLATRGARQGVSWNWSVGQGEDGLFDVLVRWRSNTLEGRLRVQDTDAGERQGVSSSRAVSSYCTCLLGHFITENWLTIDQHVHRFHILHGSVSDRMGSLLNSTPQMLLSGLHRSPVFNKESSLPYKKPEIVYRRRWKPNCVTIFMNAFFRST